MESYSCAFGAELGAGTRISIASTLSPGFGKVSHTVCCVFPSLRRKPRLALVRGCDAYPMLNNWQHYFED